MRHILISAYACEPLKGSEQGVGWNWVLQMAKTNYLHVITRANNKELIEAHLPAAVAKNITFYYYDTHRYIKKLKNKAKGLYLYYFFWQLGIIPVIRKIKKENSLNYSMHLTMGSIWMPTFLPFFKIPFLWGPVGGGEGEPNEFIKTLPAKQKLLQYLRLVLNKTLNLNPIIIYSIWRAKIILCRTNNTAHLIPKRFRHKVDIILETAIETEIFEYKRLDNNNNNIIKLITTGRLMPSKNTKSILNALKLIKSKTEIHLTIIGSGSEKQKILKETESLKENIKVELIEEISRQEVLAKLEQSDIYVFPSLREGGSWALMEAMAIGLPVICLNWTGMEIITDESCAISLPVTNPEQMPKDMATAIDELINKPDLRFKMGEAGRNRIKSEFNWDAKREFMEQVLNELDKTNF